MRCLYQQESGFDQLCCSGTGLQMIHQQELLQLKKLFSLGSFYSFVIQSCETANLSKLSDTTTDVKHPEKSKYLITHPDCVQTL